MSIFAPCEQPPTQTALSLLPVGTVTAPCRQGRGDSWLGLCLPGAIGFGGVVQEISLAEELICRVGLGQTLPAWGKRSW